nr:hypothetical protein CPGR_01821 [Mycolicibacterium komanii]
MAKLHEEVAELVAEQTTATVIEEAADVLKVPRGDHHEHGVTLDTIGEVARNKREKRGGFAMRLWLDAIDPDPGDR